MDDDEDDGENVGSACERTVVRLEVPPEHPRGLVAQPKLLLQGTRHGPMEQLPAPTTP